MILRKSRWKSSSVIRDAGSRALSLKAFSASLSKSNLLCPGLQILLDLVRVGFYVENRVLMVSYLLLVAGLGLAVVARIVEQLGGQLRVDSKPEEGSRFSFLIPFELAAEGTEQTVSTSTTTSGKSMSTRSRTSSGSSEIDSIVEALSSDHMTNPKRTTTSTSANRTTVQPKQSPANGVFEVVDSRFPIRSLRVDEFDVDKPVDSAQIMTVAPTPMPTRVSPASGSSTPSSTDLEKLRVLVVEVPK